MKKTVIKTTVLVLGFIAITLNVSGQDTTTTSYKADDPNIVYTGRIDFTNPKKPVFSAPGVYIRAKFRGVSATVRFKDEYIWNQYLNNYNIIIDNNLVVKLRPSTSPTDTSFNIVKGLPYGDHTITFVKRNESGVGKCTFFGFDFGGTILAPEPASGRKIQIFGNSISSASANEAGSCTTWPEQILLSNASRGYGPLLARIFNADYHLTSVSGIGLVRNYSNLYDARPLPAVYNNLHLHDQNDTRKWDLSKFVPDLVLVELGTNDFSPGDNPASNPRTIMDTVLHKNTYIKFIDTLKSHWPNAKIFCIGSPMLSDTWPDATYQSRSRLDHVINEVSKHYRSLGDTNVVSVPILYLLGTGCDGSHPSTGEHRRMARQIAPYIKHYLGWEYPNGISDPNTLVDPISVTTWNNTTSIVSGLEKNQNEAFQNLTICPNPSEGESIIRWENVSNYSIIMTDIQGRTVLKLSGTGNSTKIMTKELQKGLYNIQLEQNNGFRTTTKLLVK